MPIYQYRCSICDHYFEETHPMSEGSEPRKCPECKDGMGRRILSTPAITFKNLPKGHDLTHSKRRKLWNSPDVRDFRKIN